MVITNSEINCNLCKRQIEVTEAERYVTGISFSLENKASKMEQNTLGSFQVSEKKVLRF